MLILCIGIWGVSQQGACAEPDWKPVLEPPPDQRNFRESKESFRFPIPTGLSVDYLRQITLELDDIDVTALIHREGDYAIFVPAQALQFGAHRMRIVHYAPDGDIEELANWEFEVRQSSYYRQAALDGQATINFNHMLDHKNLDPSPRQNTVDGSTSVSGAMSDANWLITGRADFIGNSNYNVLNMPRFIDVGNFLFTGQHNNITVNAGHHTIISNSLVLDTLTNRGVSATLSNAKQTYAGTAFAMHATPVTGFDQGLGVSDVRNRIDGAIVSAFPVNNHPEQQYLSLVYVRGKSDTGVTGSGVSGDSSTREGDAWALVSESRFRQQQIRLRLEYASAAMTTIDALAAVPIPELDDHAYAVLAEYQPVADISSPSPSLWKLGLLHQFVGRDFSSIANAALPRDKLLWRLFGEYSQGGFFANAGLSTETDNVRDEADLPRIRTDRLNMTMQYAPSLEFNQDGQPQYGLLGQQSYLLSFSNAKSSNASYPGTAVVSSTDLDTRAVNLTGTFNYADWNWSITQNVGTLHDNTGLQPDSDTQSTSLSGAWRLMRDRLTLVPRWQLDVNKVSGLEYKTGLLSLDMTILFWNGDVTAQLGYTQSHLEASDGTFDTTTSIYRPSLEWRLSAGARNKPGASLRLSGLFTGIKDKVTDANTIDSYQIMLTAIVGAQFGL